MHYSSGELLVPSGPLLFPTFEGCVSQYKWLVFSQLSKISSPNSCVHVPFMWPTGGASKIAIMIRQGSKGWRRNPLWGALLKHQVQPEREKDRYREKERRVEKQTRHIERDREKEKWRHRDRDSNTGRQREEETWKEEEIIQLDKERHSDCIEVEARTNIAQ